MGYSSTSKAYWVYNKRNMKVIETVNVVIDESSDSSFEKGIEKLTKEILPLELKEVQEIVEQFLLLQVLPVLWKILQI